ncbi:MAG: efflux transporter outer membrane subunit, partial [Deltaproteobacteria bacterium]|nr:efflux transporter outer membrane subunit [Deltaproteobacteria bacterium]
MGPNFAKPKASLEEKWSETTSPQVKPEPAEKIDWWSVFADPDLNSLVETGYRQNLPLQIAGIRILQSRARLGISVGAQYPQQQELFGGYSREQLSDNTAISRIDEGFDLWSTGFDTAWEMDIWGRFRRGVESATAELGSSIANYDDLLLSLVAEIASTYVQIRTFERRLDVAEENVDLQQRSLEIANARFQAGAVTELDVSQATALLRDTQSTIPPLQAGLEQSRNALSILLGRPPGEIRKLLQTRRPIPTAPAEVAVGIPAELLRRRPDIRSAELQAAAQSAQIGVARADLFPAFALTGTIAFEASDAAKLFWGSSLAGSIGPSFRWPILNYGRLRNNVRVQDAQFQELIVTYQDTVLQAQREVEDALAAFLRSREQVSFLTDSVDASKRSVELALIQYREGQSDYQRVIDTQKTLVERQDSLITSKGEVPRNLIAVYKALGGGWEIRRGKEFVSEETKQEMRERTNWGKLLSRE